MIRITRKPAHLRNACGAADCSNPVSSIAAGRWPAKSCTSRSSSSTE